MLGEEASYKEGGGSVMWRQWHGWQQRLSVIHILLDFPMPFNSSKQEDSELA